MLLASLQPPSCIDIDKLIRKAHSSGQLSQELILLSAVASFLLQLTLGTLQRIFSSNIQLASRNLHSQRLNRITVLAHQNNLIIICNRNHSRSSWMLYPFPIGNITIRQLHLVLFHMKQCTIINILAADFCLY